MTKKNSLDILPCLTIQTILLDFAELLVHSELSCKQFLVLLVSGVVLPCLKCLNNTDLLAYKGLGNFFLFNLGNCLLSFLFHFSFKFL